MLYIDDGENPIRIPPLHDTASTAWVEIATIVQDVKLERNPELGFKKNPTLSGNADSLWTRFLKWCSLPLKCACTLYI